MKRQEQGLSFKNLTRRNVWELQENDIFRLWTQAERDADLKDNENRYIDIIKSAFSIEELKIDRPEIIKKYEERGCKVGQIRLDENTLVKWAIKKKSVIRITDLTKDNIHHISANKLVEILDRNFGGGWESLPSNTQQIILEAFEISTTTLPTERLKKKGGLYDQKTEEGFEVLEIHKGAWTEAIFIKEKSSIITDSDNDDYEEDYLNIANTDKEDDDEGFEETDEMQGDQEDEDDTFDEDKLTEESYRTTFDTNPEELDMQADDVSDDDY